MTTIDASASGQADVIAPLAPERYRRIDREAMAHAIEQRRAELGDSLLILAHHYQRACA
jgi:hypothetical protein